MRLSLLLCLAIPLGLAACKHTPTPEERDRARNQRDLGANALAEGNPRQALQELLKGEELNPEDPDIHYALGMTYFTGFGRLKDAQKHLERAVALRKDYSDAHNALGTVLMAQGEYQQAIPHFEKAKSNLLWPTPQMAEQNLGWALYKTGKTDAAIQHLKSAINMEPKMCGAYDYLGIIYTDKQSDADAVHWMERYLAVCDNDTLRKFLPPGQLSGTLYRLGMANVRLGKRDAARSYLAACAERFPTEAAGQSCKQNLALLE